jgi:hypothetical protein
MSPLGSSEMSSSENLALLTRRWREARRSWWMDPPAAKYRAAGRYHPAGTRVRRQWLREPVLL